MTFDLPTLDHAVAKRFNKALSNGIITLHMMNEAHNQPPSAATHIVTFAVQLARQLEIDQENFYKFTDHARLFENKVIDLKEHPYSFTESEHNIFVNSLCIIIAIILQYPMELLRLSQSDAERDGAARFAQATLEAVK